MNAAVLKNVLVGLHEIRGDYLEKATICRFTLEKLFFDVLQWKIQQLTLKKKCDLTTTS